MYVYLVVFANTFKCRPNTNTCTFVIFKYKYTKCLYSNVFGPNPGINWKLD